MESEKKSKWKLWDILMSSGLFTGVAIAFVGYITSSSLLRDGKLMKRTPNFMLN